MRTTRASRRPFRPLRLVPVMALLIRCGAGWAAEAPAPMGADWGPFTARYHDAAGHWRVQAAGPFYEHVAAVPDAAVHRLAVRPFYAFDAGPETDIRRHEYLWPVGMSRRMGSEHAWRVLTAYGRTADVNDPQSAWDLKIFPIYFQGRDEADRTYFAVFPFGGRILDIALRDEVSFVLFPLYVHTKVNQTEMSSWVWPLVARTRGPGDERFRVFPFYGYALRDGRSDKRFILWPLYTSARYGYPAPEGFAYIVFPLWGHGRMGGQEFWAVLPPFFRYTRAPQAWSWYGPWPFVQVTDTKAMNQFQLWPLYGHSNYKTLDLTYVLFPFFWHVERDVRDGIESRRRFVPFLDWATVRPGTLAEPVSPAPAELQDFRIWPLVTYRREGDAAQFRTLDLWPQRQRASVERNWAPFWTLVEYRRSGENSDTEVLWGVYRRWKRGGEAVHWSVFPVFEWTDDDRGQAGRRSWSVLKGLVGYDREGPGLGVRMLYLLRF